MSGHSKWNNIAKRKGANDAKKAKIFTKIGREMAIAIKEGGSANPDFNARLRDCIAKAKANNMPNDNIKRTLDKYSGANGQVDYEANNYEGYGVGGVAVVVETLTDNKNRTVGEVRHAFTKAGGNLGTSRSRMCATCSISMARAWAPPTAYPGSSIRRALSLWRAKVWTRTLL